MSASPMKGISLENEFGPVAVKVNGTRVEIHTDGSVDAYTKAGVRGHPLANDATPQPEAAPQIGDKMKDGTVYAGYSPDTGKAMYAAPTDEPGVYDFDWAQNFAKSFKRYGHKDWRVPTKSELDVLFNNCAAIGGFNKTGSTPVGWYWSSSRGGTSLAWAQRFTDGKQLYDYRNRVSSLRLVR
jgi:hypothetical protein